MAIIIDGVTYNVNITDHSTTAEVIDKYAERVENGDLIHEVLGTYFKFQLEFDAILDPVKSNEFYMDLVKPKAVRRVTIPGLLNTFTFDCYIRVDDVKMRRHHPAGTVGNTYDRIVARFIPIKPSLRG